MKFKLNFDELHRSAAKINGSAYLGGFDLAMARRPFCEKTADQTDSPSMFRKGYIYGKKVLALE